MATTSKTFSVTLSEEAMNLIKAEALKDDRSARSWLDRFIRATLPLQPQTQPKTTLHPTPNSPNLHSHAPDIDPIGKPSTPKPRPTSTPPKAGINPDLAGDPAYSFLFED